MCESKGLELKHCDLAIIAKDNLKKCRETLWREQGENKKLRDRVALIEKYNNEIMQLIMAHNRKCEKKIDPFI